jgi:3-oxoacyl-[acyl-carrier protein] reductase
VSASPNPSRVAIVTGGAQGIGRDVAVRLGTGGGAVAVLDVDAEGAGATVERIRSGGGVAVAHRTDAKSLDDVTAAVEAVVARFGRIDVLVNAAAELGLEERKPLWEIEEHQWRGTLDGCFLVALVPCRVVVPVMLRQRSGRIVNLGSDHAHGGNGTAVTYASAKAAVEGLTRTLARSVASSGITVNCVSPGMVRTPYVERWLTPETEERARRRYPLGRIGEPRDVAGAVAFLASPDAEWITGQVIHVNGGFFIG